ncbi:MAG: DUF6291 domain-containing protein [Clostridia bacterium]
MRESFVFYKSYYSAVEQLPKKDRLKAYRAIICHGLGMEDNPDFTGGVGIVTELVYPLIDRSNARYDACRQNGKKGGRPKTEVEK